MGTSTKKIVLFFSLFFTCFPYLMYAQIVNGSAYIQTSYLEIGIDGQYGFEGANTTSAPPPSGMHYRSNTDFFGFVANPQRNNWATFDGDFFTPGTPENGWGFEIGNTGGPSAHNNCYSNKEIAGAITNWQHIADCYSVDWEGDYVNGTALHFKVNYFAQKNNLFYTTTVSITNKTGAPITDFYYYRNVDPDNNQSLSGSYITTNQIMSQPGSGSCKLAHVKATQSSPWASYMGFAGVGNNFRVYKGGFSNRDASNLWNTASGAGSASVNDEAIGIAYKVDIPAGQTITLRYVIILDDAATTAAISNLMYLSYPGSSIRPPATCTMHLDTLYTCGGSVPISVTGPTVSSFAWNWSPAAGLSTATGPSVMATPSTGTIYTATGTPLSSCYAPVSLSVYVKITTNTGVNPVINAVGSVCPTSSPFNLSANISGGIWTGIGITNATTGTFNPNIAGIGTHQIIYALNGTCYKADTVLVNVIGASTVITPVGNVCVSATPFTLTAASSGGTWSGPGIVNSATGLFNPAVAGIGTKVIHYTHTSPCYSSSSITINVINPAVTITQPSARCATSSSFYMSASMSGGTWSGTGIISASSGIFSPSVAGVGNHLVTYTVTSPCTVVDTVIVKVIPAPNATINQPSRICVSSGTITLTAATMGGTWSGYGIYGLSSGTFNPAITGPGRFLVTYTLYSPCYATDTAYVTVLGNNATISRPTPRCVNSASFYLSAATSGGTWSGPGIVNAVSGYFNPSVAGAGNHIISYTLPAPCTGFDTVIVKVNPIPNATITQPAIICSSSRVQTLTAATSGGVWSGTGITNTSTGTFNPATSGPGRFLISYTIYSPCYATDTVYVTVLGDNATINRPTPRCINSASFYLSAATSGGTWSGPGIVNAVSGHFNPSVAGAGNHIISYTLPGPCAGFDTVIVKVNPIPNATITQPATMCNTSGIITLTAATSGGVWSGPGITNTSTGTFNPATSGIGRFLISYTIYSPCYATDTVYVTVVNPNPTIAQHAPVCTNKTPFSFSAVSGGGTWSGPGIVNAATGLFNPSVAGVGQHIISYKITSPCVRMDTIKITVVPTPNSQINAIDSLCNLPYPVTLSASMLGGVWSGNGITNSMSGTFVPSVAGVGAHNIIYTITTSCVVRDTISVNVFATPDATIMPVDDLCLKSNPVTMVAVTSGGRWSGTGIVNTAAGMFDPQSAGVGTHKVVYTLTNPCTVTDTLLVTVYAPPALTITYPSSVCLVNSPVTLTASVSGGTWSGNGIVNSSTGVFDPAIAGQGTHYIHYSVYSPCVLSDSVLIEVNTPPNPEIISPATVCENSGNTRLYSVMPGGVWSGAGIVDSIRGTFRATHPGTFQVKYTIKQQSCKVSDTDSVTVKKYSNVSLTLPDGLCEKSTPVTLYASSAAGEWSGDGIVDKYSGIFDPSTVASGIYTINYVSAVQCTHPASGSIEVYALPVPEISSDITRGCAPLCVNLTETNAHSIVAYQFGNGMEDNKGVYCYDKGGVYDITLTVSDNNSCVGIRTFPRYITVFDNPVAQIMVSSEKAEINDSVYFKNLTPDLSAYSWTIEGKNYQGNMSDTSAFMYSFDNAGMYCINLEVTNEAGCKGVSEKCIEIFDTYTMEIPNVFTPNGDGTNDMFMVYGEGVKSLKAIVYNRWGKAVAEWDGIENGWDGKSSSGEVAPDGVYYFYIAVETNAGYTKEFKGWLQILR